eukprot:Rmarinus@m.2083
MPRNVHALVDKAYATVVNRSLFFSKGWGQQKVLDDMVDHLSQIQSGIPPISPIDISWGKETRLGSVRLRVGSFVSPVPHEYLPRESHCGSVMVCEPVAGPSLVRGEGGTTSGGMKKLRDARYTIHLAATGDHTFLRRLFSLALPLAKAGVASVILQNPYYGNRKPRSQPGSKLHSATDLMLLGHTTIQEARSLLSYLRAAGVGHVGVTGLSMGGLHAAMTASLSPFPVAATPCLAPHSAAWVFTEGILSRACDWSVLGDETKDPPDWQVPSKLMSLPAAVQDFPAVDAERDSELWVKGAGVTDNPVAKRKYQNFKEKLKRTASSALSVFSALREDASRLGWAAESVEATGSKQRVRNDEFEAASSKQRVRTSEASGIPGTASSNDPSVHTRGYYRNNWRITEGDAYANLTSPYPFYSWGNLSRTEAMGRKRLRQIYATTDIRNFPQPMCPDAVVMVGARNDLYVSDDCIKTFHAHFPKASVRWVNGGHVSSYVGNRKVFARAVIESFDRLD